MSDDYSEIDDYCKKHNIKPAEDAIKVFKEGFAKAMSEQTTVEFENCTAAFTKCPSCATTSALLEKAVEALEQARVMATNAFLYNDGKSIIAASDFKEIQDFINDELTELTAQKG
jgi:protein-disulfide isomerase